MLVSKKNVRSRIFELTRVLYRNCKAKKVKCGEEKPRCLNCERNNEDVCDYSIRLNWGGRAKRKGTSTPEPSSPGRPSSATSGSIPGMATMTFDIDSPATSTLSQHSPAMSSIQQFDSPKAFSPRMPAQPFDAFTLDSLGRPPTSAAPTSFPIPTSSPMQLSSPFNLENKSPPVAGGQRPAGPNPIHPSKRPRRGVASDPIFNSQTFQTPSLRHQSSSPGHLFQQSYTSTYVPSPSSTGIGDFGGRKGQPLTPSASSIASEENTPTQSQAFIPVHTEEEDPRRLSVNSLLIKEEFDAKTRPYVSRKDSDDRFQFFGIDRGLPDLDIPNNDDVHVLDLVTPVLSSAEFGKYENESLNEFGFGLASNKVSSYTESCQVKISKTLLPLPSILLDNRMNLMYFHFFIEHTARILVPHDCPANPFKIILPQMAVRDENLLHLLLAYSASHRARLLGHPDPTTRIAYWVSNVFPNLRRVLEAPAPEISPADVATAIMLASLAIIAPGTFEIEIPWQNHLSIARRMIASRGGSKNIDVNRDRVSHFLIRWFAYLDILGNFSSTGIKKEPVMFSGDLYEFNNENDFSIDCILGFSGFLSGLLARIAELSRQCDEDRLTCDGQINADWRPTQDIVKKAESIKAGLAIARQQKYTICPHRHSTSESESAWELAEMVATNEAFHWAGLVHLNRRVLGLPQDSPEVQSAVSEIIGTIYKVRKGGSAEACLIFPMFTAGCQAQKTSQRDLILDRIKSVESSGMTQVSIY
jgi:hypothetical protein